MRYYTVDRCNRYSHGYILNLTSHTDFTPQYLQDHVDTMFPFGVSFHGNNYFLNGSSSASTVNPNIELQWEYARRANYPGAPSRFTSMFACETLPDAREFAERIGSGTIWEVDCDNSFRADMSWLTLADSILTVSHAVNAYWNHEPISRYRITAASFWEILIPLPATIGTQVP